MMKKMLAMTAIAAMAFGAQAGVMEYTYDLTLKDVPLTSMANVKAIKCYLVDSSVSGSSATYGTKGSKLAEFEYKGISMESTKVNNVQYSTKSYKLSGSQYGDSSDKFAADLRKKDGYIGQVTFESQKIEWQDMGTTKAAVDDYAAKNLTAYLVVTTEEEGGVLVDHEFTIDVTANGSEVALGSSATYQEVIPEPTSGMLVFLGLAGLMLKRKRAA